MKWFSNKINTVGNFLEISSNSFGEIASDLIETPGNSLSDGLRIIGSGVPIWSQIMDWIGAAISSITDFSGMLIKSLTGLLGGLSAGIIRISGGTLSLNRTLVKTGLGDIWNGLFGSLVIIVLGLAGVLQQIIPWVQVKDRRMTSKEMEDMARIYGGSLAFYNIRVVEGKRAGIYSISDRALVIGNTIFMKGHNYTTHPSVFAHEMGHVWQYQNKGVKYISEAIWAQLFIKEAYDWEKELSDKKWEDFNPEAQCEFIKVLYTYGRLTGGSYKQGAFFDANENNSGIFYFGNPKISHTQLAHEVWEKLKANRSKRLSYLIQNSVHNKNGQDHLIQSTSEVTH